MSEATIDLIDRLVARFPPLEPILREHIADNFGEVLPHLFFGDLTRFVVQQYCEQMSSDSGPRAATDSKPIVGELLDALEDEFTHGTSEVQELIAVSFLENLPARGERGEGIRELLGREMASELSRIA
ncbi:MAG: hypothetical protein DCC49_13905 [Acidobacteria bacterium]|nr:MAG: hypothetical protein DCC49_13905 [Acidobacteriota bacterium]